MGQITLKGNVIHTVGDLPGVHQVAPDFSLTKADLSSCALSDFKGQKVILNIFPSLDTDICAMSVRQFNQQAGQLEGVKVLCISADLPFAHNRFCTTEHIENVIGLSVFRSPSFGDDYGVTMTDGPLMGLLARAVVLIGEDGKVIYHQLVPEIAQEPDYQAVFDQVK